MKWVITAVVIAFVSITTLFAICAVIISGKCDEYVLENAGIGTPQREDRKEAAQQQQGEQTSFPSPALHELS